MLTNAEIKAFRRGGLFDFEIGAISADLRTRPQKIDPNNEAWQEVFRKRLNYIRTQLNKGLTLRQIEAKAISYAKKQSLWDFLREAYPIKGGKKADFVKRAEARARITDHFGRQYK